MKSFSDELKTGLVWLPALGMGYYPVPKNRPYDEGYFARYQKMADTPMGRELTQARIRLVARHYDGPLVDVGIGAGQFVGTRPNTRGYDVNPAGVAWLNQRGLWADLYADRYPALSMWDSLEHIDRPDVAVAKAEKWVFVSVPIFADGDAILTSRHFRKDEHIWYWTHNGLLRWFDGQGFDCIEHNTMETKLGREGIGSYAFRRRT
ncbi:class I SAM-dependent methyltransferase [Candidatus Pantoea gossypiicola]|uniref:Class I SAM-dependent methyltransferase n=1 Tax=Candidatus Pantoea gossypiicola TaxID=2608008 RepID=A0AB34CCK6_9GAMM|nr:methyltransferase domain-containing protein [Pantoea gossypiicola]KAA6118136.1 class I SAM-dependent methyltransferase [Pantoea gossypiicola]